MKKLLIILCLFLIFNVNSFANKDEDNFWVNYLNGNYKIAGDIARNIGLHNNLYYMIASSCYYYIDDYSGSQLTKKSFNAKKQLNKLATLLNIKESENKTNFHIYLLLGNIKRFLPDIKLNNYEYYYKKSIDINPSNAYAYNELSMYYAFNNDYLNSIQFAEKSIQLMPGFPEPYNNLAFAYFNMNNKQLAIDKLIECMNKCKSVPNNTFQSLIYLAGTSAMNTIAPNGKTMIIEVPIIKDNSILRRIINTGSTQPNNLLLIAEYFIERGENKQFENVIYDLNVPSEFENLLKYVKANYYYYGGNSDKFSILTEELLINNFNDYHRLLNIGNTYMEMNAPGKAIIFYKKALDCLDPLDFNYKLKLFSNIGGSYLMAEDYNNSILYMNKALEIIPDDTITLFNLGIAYYNLNNYSKAKLYFNKALKTTSKQQYINNINSWLDKINNKCTVRVFT